MIKGRTREGFHLRYIFYNVISSCMNDFVHTFAVDKTIY
jgi:hypothetical protein